MLLMDMENVDLATLCARIAEAYHKDKTAIDGTTFAYLAKRLLAAEIQPGGPYRDIKGGTMPYLNAAIGRLFIYMSKPLPNVDTYLRSLKHSDLTPADSIAINQYKTAQQAASFARPLLKTSTPYQLAQATLESFEEPIKTQALKFLARVEQADTTHEIALISHFTARAVNAATPLDTLNKLGEANIHGWIAYMIYDHIIDHDASVQLLPVANICMRLSLSQYRRVAPVNHSIQKTITRYFDQVDTANAWELAHCRYEISNRTIRIRSLPDYEKSEILASRSAIHVLGPIILASLASPLSRRPKKMEQFISGLRQYLIARQLSDDIHDWREDLQGGQISAVVARLLRDNNIQQKNHSISNLTAMLQHSFLQQTSQDISTDIINHAQNATNMLIEAGCNSSSELVNLITRLEEMAKGSIKQRSSFLEFQHEYQANTLLIAPTMV